MAALETKGTQWGEVRAKAEGKEMHHSGRAVHDHRSLPSVLESPNEACPEIQVHKYLPSTASSVYAARNSIQFHQPGGFWLRAPWKGRYKRDVDFWELFLGQLLSILDLFQREALLLPTDSDIRCTLQSSWGFLLGLRLKK